jgi:probable rRNA maturation factor
MGTSPAPGDLFDISHEDGAQAPLTDDEIRRAVAYVLAEEGVGRPCLVSVSVVGDGRIHELNREWRGVDRATDVISLECERPDDADLAEGEPCELGDIALAPAYIARQAEGFGTTPAAEFTLLLVHGMLHLLGYDHVEEADAEVMEAREDELVRGLLGGGGLGHVATTRHRDAEGA